MTRLILALLLVLIATVPGAALAQEEPTASPTTSTPTASTTTANNSTASTGPTALARVDKLTIVTDYELRGGNLWIEFYSNGGNTLSITETTSTDGATNVRIRQEDIPRGYSTTTIDLYDTDDPSVLITSRLSLQENTGTKVSIDTGSSIIPGPWDGSDVRDAGIGGALGVVIAVLYEAVSAKIGASQRGEQVA